MSFSSCPGFHAASPAWFSMEPSQSVRKFLCAGVDWLVSCALSSVTQTGEGGLLGIQSAEGLGDVSDFSTSLEPSGHLRRVLAGRAALSQHGLAASELAERVAGASRVLRVLGDFPRGVGDIGLARLLTPCSAGSCWRVPRGRVGGVVLAAFPRGRVGANAPPGV